MIQFGSKTLGHPLFAYKKSRWAGARSICLLHHELSSVQYKNVKQTEKQQ
jgi:hypothetical protein